MGNATYLLGNPSACALSVDICTIIFWSCWIGKADVWSYLIHTNEVWLMVSVIYSKILYGKLVAHVGLHNAFQDIQLELIIMLSESGIICRISRRVSQRYSRNQGRRFFSISLCSYYGNCFELFVANCSKLLAVKSLCFKFCTIRI